MSVRATLSLCRRWPRIVNCQQKTYFHSTVVAAKVRKTTGKKDPNSALHHATMAANENQFVKGAMKEMSECETILLDELAKHFSVKADLRVYEEMIVTLDDGQETKLSHLGRVSFKSPQVIAVNMADNSSRIKNVKLALQKGGLGGSMQQEGVVLYISVPRMTRERREHLANEAKSRIFNDYKEALNKIYSRFDKMSSRECKTGDDEKKTRAQLLELKRGMEGRGLDLTERKRKELLTEVL